MEIQNANSRKLGTWYGRQSLDSFPCVQQRVGLERNDYYLTAEDQTTLQS